MARFQVCRYQIERHPALMWNETHSELLREIILGTDLLKKAESRLSLEASSVLLNNERSLDFKGLLDLATLDSANLPTVHKACKFLLREFGQIWTVTNIKLGIYPLIDYKQ